MNRRQKMKRMKQKLEWYQNRDSVERPVLYPSAPYEIRTLAVDRMFSREDAEILGEDRIRDILAEDLLEGVNEAIEVSSYDAGFGYSDARHFRAELKVAVLRK